MIETPVRKETFKQHHVSRTILFVKHEDKPEVAILKSRYVRDLVMLSYRPPHGTRRNIRSVRRHGPYPFLGFNVDRFSFRLSKNDKRLHKLTINSKVG